MKLLTLTFAFVLVGTFQARAADPAPAAPEAKAEHEVHKDHPHKHGDKCGHKSSQHGEHKDYAHDGHKHKVDGDHIDECK